MCVCLYEGGLQRREHGSGRDRTHQLKAALYDLLPDWIRRTSRHQNQGPSAHADPSKTLRHTHFLRTWLLSTMRCWTIHCSRCLRLWESTKACTIKLGEVSENKSQRQEPMLIFHSLLLSERLARHALTTPVSVHNSNLS